VSGLARSRHCLQPDGIRPSRMGAGAGPGAGGGRAR